MKNFFVLSFLVLNVAILSACHIGKGYPGEAPNVVTCNPGHETAKDCPTRITIKP